MLYHALVEIEYDHPQSIISFTIQHPAIYVNLWCNFWLDVLEVHSNDETIIDLQNTELKKFFGDFSVLTSASKTTPLVIRTCQCPSSPITTLLHKYDSFHLPPVIYKENREILHVVITSEEADMLFDEIKQDSTIKNVSLRQLAPFKFPDQPYPIYLSINDIVKNMTMRQINALVEAYNNGYYDLPRKVTTEELAKKFLINRRTYEEHLRKAEKEIVNTLIPFIVMNFANKSNNGFIHPLQVLSSS